ncbi:MAG: hypothetical protein AB8G99_01520 [Planctomycetaceae bacterium]
MPEPTASTSQTPLARFATSFLTVAIVLGVSQVCAAQEDLGKARDAAQKLKKPLYDDFEQAEEDFNKNTKRAFDRILPRGAKTRIERIKLTEGIEHYCKMLTDPDLLSVELRDKRDKFQRQLDKAATLANTQQRKLREDTYKIVVEQASKLLDGNYYVREQAINLIGGLNVANRPPAPFVGSRAALLKVARTSPFPRHRLLAMGYLHRIVRFVKLPRNEEMEIAMIMSAELMKPGLDSGLYYRIAQWLGDIRYTLDVVGAQKPSAAIGLVTSLSDEKRSWISRAIAAHSLGDTGDGSNIKWPLIAWKIAEFTHEAGVEFERQRKIKGRVPAPVDPEAMADCIFAFTPSTQKEIDAGKGLKNRSSDPITTQAYQKMLPVIAGALSQKGKIDAKALTDLKTWVDANRPKDLIYHAKAPPLPMKPVKPANGP